MPTRKARRERSTSRTPTTKSMRTAEKRMAKEGAKGMTGFNRQGKAVDTGIRVIPVGRPKKARRS